MPKYTVSVSFVLDEDDTSAASAATFIYDLIRNGGHDCRKLLVRNDDNEHETLVTMKDGGIQEMKRVR